MDLLKNKKLIIFDFDETLCKTNGFIKRTNYSSSKEDFLTPGEYSEWRDTGEYNLNPSIWDLDFKSFTGYPSEGEIIPETFCLLKQHISDDDCIVALVTGRDELSGPHDFLSNNQIDVNKMILFCSGDPNKRMCYESLIYTLKPVSILIYEDSISHIKQCNEVCEKYDIAFDSILVQSGKINWKWQIKTEETN